MLANTLLGLSILPFAFAHFNLDYPPSRGFDDDKEGDFPCGSFNDVQQQRTDFPISGGPIQLRMGHQQTNVAVYMAIGDNPGSNFNIVAKQQLMVTGLGQFCIANVAVPEGMNVTDGTKATIQVVTNNHEAGGLYQVRCPTAVIATQSLC
jgi:nascent polypeptide-associated complex subunit beta